MGTRQNGRNAYPRRMMKTKQFRSGQNPAAKAIGNRESGTVSMVGVSRKQSDCVLLISKTAIE